MSSRDRFYFAIIIGAVTILGLLLNHGLTLLTPFPDSPEISRAKADEIIMRAKADIENQQLYRTFAVGVAILLFGLSICFGSIVLAFYIIRKSLAVDVTPQQKLLSLPQPPSKTA